MAAVLTMTLKLNAALLLQRFWLHVNVQRLYVYVLLLTCLINTRLLRFHLFLIWKNLSTCSKVLQKLREANLKCIVDKVHLLLSQIKALGYIVNGQGITTNKAVVEDLLKFPAPRNQSGVRSFLGLAGSYEKFIENFRIIAEPLYMLLRKDVDFSWGEIQNKAFEIIKSKLASAPVLIHFDWTKALLVKMDASLGGAGAVLLQLLDELQWHPVAFVSWLFNRTQRNYSTTDRELLTLLLLTRKFRSYFFAREITVLTDHQPIPGYLRKD